MSKNKYRKQVFQQESESGRFIYRFYDTGTLSVFDPERGLEPNKSGSDGAFFRFTNLNKAAEAGQLEQILKYLDATLPLNYRYTLDYAAYAREELLLDFLNHSEPPSLFSLAAFMAATAEARSLKFSEALELAEPQRELLQRAADTGTLHRIFRPELSFASSDLIHKREGVDGVRELLGEISARNSHPAFKIAFERFFSGHETAISELYRTLTPVNRTSNDFYPRMILTSSEVEEFEEILKRFNMAMTYRSFDPELGLWLAHTFLRYGETRLKEALQFIESYRGEQERVWYGAYRLDTLDHPNGPVTVKSLYEAAADVNIELEWAMLLAI